MVCPPRQSGKLAHPTGFLDHTLIVIKDDCASQMAGPIHLTTLAMALHDGPVAGQLVVGQHLVLLYAFGQGLLKTKTA